MCSNVNSTDVFCKAAVSKVHEQALPLLRERLDEYGYMHSCNTAETAEYLAGLYQVDSGEAFIAGLLHDWDRGHARDQLIARARDIGFDITPEVVAAPQILHAHTGAADVRKIFPHLPDSVITAIRHHTVGSRDMSDLDKVVYIADMIEPSRSSEAVTMLRDVVGVVDLDTLFLQAYQATVMHLVKNRKVMHFDTTRVWNALIMKEMDEQ
ncbi:MAG: bis(5'-nucleosyl)-tetraphosphatase (symmetrical) YqeK [Coriobacteriia bacterium]|nr:bis(5'-nucleosyl)-tetraphosphatase (symmetrical) YqeK [Coriobacteriia bacterium]